MTEADVRFPLNTNGNDVVIAVDLDGTLIRNDVTQIASWEYVKKNIFNAIKLAIWMTKGLAYFKHRLAEEVSIEPSKLDYNKVFLSYLKEQKANGVKIFLATACDVSYARKVFDYVKIFDDFFASDGVTNLRAQAKADALKKAFINGFIYAGNSIHDVPVWEASKGAILVNPSKSALRKMKGKKYILFEERK